MGPKADPETQALRKEVEDLIAKLKDEQQKVADAKIEEVCGNMSDLPRIRLTTKKLLKGHLNKVNSVHYSGDSRHAVTGSLDGKLIIWDTWTGNKVQIIPLRSSWVMSVAFSQSGNFVACGGMDNMCTVYDLNNRDSTGAAKIVRELAGYEGFLSSCRFIDDQTLITGSGDMKICLWDLEAGKRKMDFQGHCGDVVSISLSPDCKNYVTGSVDRTCKLWDLSEDKCRQMFLGHEADVNSVCFHPGGQAFSTASEDKSARLWDLRSDQQVARYETPAGKGGPGFTCCGLSLSGRYLLAGADDNSIHSWDTLKLSHCGTLSGHENRVTSLNVSPNGMAVATCSWDQYVRVWG
ncbi:guanine nucleotide-binding protein subunit beta-2 [Schistocerca piceifrons]|uniref:guanine nucleotide-binding protein subunit beta-2 n=1 Tax=Schistocerca piceifrons TaxID=274613 RepID=UPI001F5F145C|nr:guanine nucleotide-binding protein subunit beta-2 [Schistocerca piceifrons]XP_049796663.1 guanine nucleotide-binding protein subunit beta-2 [Schistocerca nitens]XP_049945259.1 guanine nucleotide-binding protein subunit beta-2 [Schistocerca serialis cubense]